jgi:hypothetical protein
VQHSLWLCILHRLYVAVWMPGTGCRCWRTAGLVESMCSGVGMARQLSLLGLCESEERVLLWQPMAAGWCGLLEDTCVRPAGEE